TLWVSIIIDECAVYIGGAVSTYATPRPAHNRMEVRMIGNCRRRKSTKDLSISAGDAASRRPNLGPLTATSDSFSCNIYLTTMRSARSPVQDYHPIGSRSWKSAILCGYVVLYYTR